MKANGKLADDVDLAEFANITKVRLQQRRLAEKQGISNPAPRREEIRKQGFSTPAPHSGEMGN